MKSSVGDLLFYIGKVAERLCSIEGETRNISVGGAFIQYSEEADLNGESQIVFENSEQRSISVTGRKAWSGNFNIDGKSVFSAVGVRFTEISREDREFISSLDQGV